MISWPAPGVWAWMALLGGCGTLHGARPLHPGQHEVGLTVGGPMVDIGAPIPFPNVVVGARSGLGTLAGRPLDLGYGANAAALPFGVVALHGDLGWLAVEQRGARPAVALRNRLFWAFSGLAPKEADVADAAWAADTVELIVSWKLGEHVVHGALGQTFDIGDPSLVLVPAVGATIDPGRAGGLTFQPEIRWWAINRANHQRNIPWVPQTPGALGIHLGLGYRFGKRP